MADLTELKNMVMSFRVSELQVLLGFAGRNKSGRKQELLQRALTLLHRGCNHPIQIKIKELYSLPDGADPYRCIGYRLLITLSELMSKGPGEANVNLVVSRRRRYPGKPSTSPPHPVQPPPRMTCSVQGYGAYPNSSTLGYPKPTISTSSSQSSTIPIHPDVRFKWLPFYDVRGELLKPSSLAPRNQSRFQENVFVFHLTPQQAQEISMSRDLRPGARYEFTVQVQLRFCLLETSCAQEDNFPPSVCVRVNDKLATLPNPIPTNKPGVEPKRPSRPVNITSICRLSPTVANQVNITWASEYGRSYCVGISLVRRLTADILLQRLRASGVRHPDHTRALIKEKLAQDPDSEIATTSLRVSLLCPLGKMRMAIPCRASVCTHLQCFDATTYLQMNEKKPSWTCPICDGPAEFDKLTIDGLFTEIINQVSETQEIELLDDGRWQPMKPKENSDKITNHVIQTIGDSPKKPEPDVIDLTETDDEDDMAVINTSTYSSDSASSASDSSIVTATPTPSSNDSEDLKIIGPSTTATLAPIAAASQGVVSSMAAPTNSSGSLAADACRVGSQSPIWPTSRSPSPPGIDLSLTRSSPGRRSSPAHPPPGTPLSGLPPAPPRPSSSLSTPPPPSQGHPELSSESPSLLYNNPPPRRSSYRSYANTSISCMAAAAAAAASSSAGSFPTLPRLPEPPPLLPITMPPEVAPLGVHPPIPDYFRSDMDMSNLDLFSLLQDTDREFDIRRPTFGTGHPATSSESCVSRSHTVSSSTLSRSSSNYGDRSSPECISID